MSNAIKKVGLALGRKNLRVGKVAKELIALLVNHKVDTCIIKREDAQGLDTYGLPLITADKVGANCDVVLIIGGDGTFIHFAVANLESQVPLLGINCGRVGFLTEVAADQLDQAIPELLAGKYIVSERMLLKGEFEFRSNKNGKDKKAKAPVIGMNDLVVQALNGRLLEVKLMIDDKFVYCERSDGIIVATSAGSSAYALSVGGPVITFDAKAIEVVTISPQTLTSRPLVVPEEAKICIELVGGSAVACYADGHNQTKISTGDKIRITKHSLHAQIIHLESYDIFSSYRSKLGWHSDSENNK